MAIAVRLADQRFGLACHEKPLMVTANAAPLLKPLRRIHLRIFRSSPASSVQRDGGAFRCGPRPRDMDGRCPLLAIRVPCGLTLCPTWRWEQRKAGPSRVPCRGWGLGFVRISPSVRRLTAPRTARGRVNRDPAKWSRLGAIARAVDSAPTADGRVNPPYLARSHERWSWLYDIVRYVGA